MPLDGGPWSLATYVQPGLALIAKRVALGKHAALDSVPIAELGAFADLGPYHMQVKNPKHGLFTVREQPTAAAPPEWKLRAGVPALWHHKAARNTCLAASPDELARTMPVLDVDRLSNGQLAAAAGVYADLKYRELQGFTALAEDPVRRELNERLCREVLGIDPEIVADVTRKLALEPTLHARH